MVALIFRLGTALACAVLLSVATFAQEKPKSKLAEILIGLDEVKDDEEFQHWIQLLASHGRLEDEGVALERMAKILITETMSRRRYAAEAFESWPQSRAALDAAGAAASKVMRVYEVLFHADVNPELLDSERVKRWTKYVQVPKDSPEELRTFLSHLEKMQLSIAQILATYDDDVAQGWVGIMLGTQEVLPRDPMPYSKRTLNLIQVAIEVDTVEVLTAVCANNLRCFMDDDEIRSILEGRRELPDSWRKTPIEEVQDLRLVSRQIKQHLDSVAKLLEPVAKRHGIHPPRNGSDSELRRFWKARLNPAGVQPSEGDPPPLEPEPAENPESAAGIELEKLKDLERIFVERQPRKSGLKALKQWADRVRADDPKAAIDVLSKGLQVASMSFRVSAMELIVQEPATSHQRSVLLTMGREWLEFERQAQEWLFDHEAEAVGEPYFDWLHARGIELEKNERGFYEDSTVDNCWLATCRFQTHVAQGLAKFNDDESRSLLRDFMVVELDDPHNGVFVKALLRHKDAKSLQVVLDHQAVMFGLHRDLKKQAAKDQKLRDKVDRDQVRAGREPLVRGPVWNSAVIHIKEPVESFARCDAHVEELATMLSQFAAENGIRKPPLRPTSSSWRAWGKQAVEELGAK
tara:strand:+ start:20033 stop:21937 length:1905 start_codon:yes stop_codon:yes gene_type:complete